MKALAVLGSTGSIGQQTLDIVRRNPTQFRVTAMSAGQNVALLKQQIQEFSPAAVWVESLEAANELDAIFGSSTKIFRGRANSVKGIEKPDASINSELCEMVSRDDIDIVVAGISGFACLPPVLAAIQAGKHIALANKECVVAAGQLVRSALRSSSSVMVPVDSEHSSVFQCYRGANERDDIARVILTASGGPFYRRERSSLANVSPEDAVRHPRWSMGRKISVDSATLMNKGLEVIEAAWLFELPAESVGVLIHPQSIVHGMLEYADHTISAILYEPDMRAPISFALGYLSSENPKDQPGARISKNGVPPLDLALRGPLEFLPANESQFPSLGLAYDALRAAGSMPCVLNAANEIAVARFLEHQLGFLQMSEIVAETMARHRPETALAIEQVFEVDAWARKIASELCGQ